MNITSVYIPEQPRDQVAIHAWDQDGMVWSQKGERALDGRLFRFLLAGQTTDQREVSFKYHFLTEDDRWESDEYVRTIPTRTATSLWTFDYTARCLVQDPGPTAAFPTVTIHVITQRRYRGGQLFLWSPDGTQQPPTARCSETQRDDTAATSTFVVPLSDWMRDGFHFKLLGSANNFGDFEPERANRVWRPSDGENIWIKSGQVDVRSQPLALVSTSVNFLHPQSMAVPQLHIQDLVDDFEAILDPLSTIATDAQFLRSQFQISIYPNAIYELRWTSEPLSTVRRFQVPLDGPPEPSFAVNGYDRWLVQLPTEQTTQVKIVIHPNPASTFGATAQLQVGIGYAEAHQQLSATKQLDDTWEVQFSTLVNVPYWLEVLGESRSDGSFSSRRLFTAADSETTTLHTIDGVSGLNRAWQNPFQDVPPPLRRRLMEATYSPAIVAAGVFDPWEMPHGVTALGSDIYFVLRAPHTVQSTLLLMPLANAPGTPRTVTQVALSLTHDLRYWWCAVPLMQVPPGTHYRFLLSDGQEVLDPASRWALDQGHLVVQAGTGAEQSWSRVVDTGTISRIFDGSAWRTVGWESLLIYEIHSLRFTQRNQNDSQTALAFDQIIAELALGRYLQRLPVTALELMPVHEFPGEQSWGYNPSLFFGVDSFYGGPEGFARCMRASHDAGKAVLLDIVFNHLMESPLQTIARDVYVDGETSWGDMINYDHPAVLEFFRQALVYLWFTFKLDGFRFDATEAIINGGRDDTFSAPYILARGPDGKLRVGSGGGWEFLRDLRTALRKAADATGQPWPYLVGENDPNNWPMTEVHHGVLDGQWHFAHHYRLNDAARNDDDRADGIRQAMNCPYTQQRPFYEAVRYGESHDSVSSQGGKQRIVRRERYGYGRCMAKAVGAAALLAKGVPMLFMGEEAGEDLPFAFDMKATDPVFVLRLDAYEQVGSELNRILTWFHHLMGLQNNPSNGLRGDDDQSVGIGHKTVAFTRGGGRFFVIVTFGTNDQQQDLAWLGLPSGSPYKEIFNSSWPEYQVHNEPELTNGGYNAQLRSGDLIRLPSIGALVLERR